MSLLFLTLAVVSSVMAIAMYLEILSFGVKWNLATILGTLIASVVATLSHIKSSGHRKNAKKELDPADAVEELSSVWFTLHQRRRTLHHWASFLGIASSATAAVGAQDIPGVVVNSLGATALVSLGFLTFFRPLERSTCFVRAWRIVHVALLRFRAGEIEIGGLLDAYEHAEDTISYCD